MGLSPRVWLDIQQACEVYSRVSRIFYPQLSSLTIRHKKTFSPTLGEKVFVRARSRMNGFDMKPSPRPPDRMGIKGDGLLRSVRPVSGYQRRIVPSNSEKRETNPLGEYSRFPSNHLPWLSHWLESHTNLNRWGLMSRLIRALSSLGTLTNSNPNFPTTPQRTLARETTTGAL